MYEGTLFFLQGNLAQTFKRAIWFCCDSGGQLQDIYRRVSVFKPTFTFFLAEKWI
jgi:hypothetical protein